jgi:thymidylate kinase
MISQPEADVADPNARGGRSRRRLIVLMGLDGSGKSTQAEAAAKWFAEERIESAVVWLRGESYLTRPVLRIAKWFLRAPKGKKRGEAETPEAYDKYVTGKRSMFRSGLARAIWRNLVLVDFYITYRLAFSKIDRRAKVVILDRYLYDSLIDIATAFGSGPDEVKHLLGSWRTKVFPGPDRVILLDLEPTVAMRRKDDIPSMEYLEERHGLYRALAAELGATVVDASQPVDQVARSIKDSLADLAV